MAQMIHILFPKSSGAVNTLAQIIPFLAQTNKSLPFTFLHYMYMHNNVLSGIRG